MGRPRFTSTERLAVFHRPRPIGHSFPLPETCWHCGAALSADAFHVDHHPVAFRDIEGQVCLGVINAKDVTNLVPSCPSCNLSHIHEQRSWCGASQPRVTRVGLWQCYGVVVTAVALALLVWGPSLTCGINGL